MNLTKEEVSLANRIKSQEKFDYYWWHMSGLLPCAVISGLGVWYKSDAVSYSGLISIVFFQGYMLLRQTRNLDVLKSLISKIDRAGSIDPQ